MDCVDFFLYPDKTSARYIRRALARRHGALIGKQVGTWLDLYALVQGSYCLAPPLSCWDDKIADALPTLPMAFWLDSLKTDPRNTQQIVPNALTDLLVACGPKNKLSEDMASEERAWNNLRISDAGFLFLVDRSQEAHMPTGNVGSRVTQEQLPSSSTQRLRSFEQGQKDKSECGSYFMHVPNLSPRGAKQISDLIRLGKKLENALPPYLAVINSLIEAPSGQFIRNINVYHAPDILPADPWQTAFLERLAEDSENANDPGLMKDLHHLLGFQPKSRPTSVLNQLQTRLFLTSDKRCRSRNGRQWIGVRDYLQEVEIAVGMIQQMALEADTKYKDVGLLIPNTVTYTQAAGQLFHHAGIPLSGMTVLTGQRDLGNELIYQFLHSRQPGATPMALATLLGSPLLPWKEKGTQIAQMVMEGAWRSNLEAEIPEDQHLLLGILTGKALTDPCRLSASLKGLAGHIEQQEEPTAHHRTALTTIHGLLKLLQDVAEIPWESLFRESRPDTLLSEEKSEISIEGVTVFHPDKLPWRRIKHLIVLGFEQGRYPEDFKGASVIPEQDRQRLKDQGIPIRTAAQRRHEARRLFKWQLSAASASLTFLIPRVDPFGVIVNPSASLSFMAQLFANSESDKDLILELERQEDRQNIAYLAQTKPVKPKPPRNLVSEDLELGENLLTLRKNSEGKTAAESPSGLEKLMVSPLAWVMRRYGIESHAWEAQRLDVLINGSIAHDVFEQLFRHDKPLPTKKQLTRKLPGAVQQTLSKDYPFLLEPEWRIERKQMISELSKAALAWRDFLNKNGIELLAEEAWLKGRFNKHPIHGKADLIFATKADKLFVVDYKRSKSAGRRKSMEKGFDHQTSLYRLMIQKGTLPDDAPPKLKRLQKKGKEVGALYYTLLDQTVLGDQLADSLSDTEAIDMEISKAALAKIRLKMNEVRSGKIILNTGRDEDFFENQAGITPYALDDSPLISLFMKAGEES